MTWNRNEPYSREKPIVAFVDGVETPFSVMLSASRIAPDEKGKKTVVEGAFICRMGNEYHVLPRANVNASFSTGSKIGTISLPRLFAAGDVLTVIEGHQIVTFSGTWNASNTLEMTLPTGTMAAISLGAGNGSVSPNTIALTVANFINNDPVASYYMFASASGNSVYIYNQKDLSVPVLNLETNSTTGTIAFNAKGSFTILGTIQFVDYRTGAVTLMDNAAVNAPPGAHVGVVVDEVYGVYPHALDMTNKPRFAIAPVAGAHGIYEGSLPYIDSDLKRRLPRIRFAMKF